VALLFYYGSGSPFAWRVWLALEHKQIPYELRVLSFDQGDTRKPDYLAINPRGKVPAIVDDGFALYESAAIIEYLDERFLDGPALFPEDVQERAVVRRVIREADHHVGVRVQALGREIFRRKPAERDRAAIAAHADAIRDELAHYAPASEYLCGELGAADFTLYPLLAMLPRYDRFAENLGLAAAITPALAAWMKKIEALPYFAKTYPPHWK
jgi:glutathione S-transferase